MRFTLLAIAIITLLLAACAGAPQPPLLSITATDFKFDAPDTVGGGLTRLQLTNNGKEDHHAQLVRLNDGVTVPQFQQAFEAAVKANFQGPTLGQALSLITFQAGAPATTPGKKAEAVFNVPPGQYVMVCFIPSADGVPHAAKGMVKPLTVGSAPAKQPAEPSATATISLGEFAFAGVPQDVKAGKVTWALTNIGKEPHEMDLVKLKAPAAQVKQILSAPPPAGGAPPGPPPWDEAGGFGAFMPGGKGWAMLDLEKGEYALICHIPSPANQGKEHVALGMFAAFTVK